MVDQIISDFILSSFEDGSFIKVNEPTPGTCIP